MGLDLPHSSRSLLWFCTLSAICLHSFWLFFSCRLFFLCNSCTHTTNLSVLVSYCLAYFNFTTEKFNPPPPPSLYQRVTWNSIKFNIWHIVREVRLVRERERERERDRDRDRDRDRERERERDGSDVTLVAFKHFVSDFYNRLASHIMVILSPVC